MLLTPTLVALLCAGAPAAEAPASQAPAAARSPYVYVWNDGDRRREIWLDPELLAEFEPSDEGARWVHEAALSAEPVPTKGKGVRMWRLPAGAASAVSKALADRGRFSPVFRDGANRASRRRALAGGVVVHLKKDLSRAAVEAWARATGREVRREVIPGANVFLVASPPGLASLELANGLARSGEILAAYPNWWLEAYPR